MGVAIEPLSPQWKPTGVGEARYVLQVVVAPAAELAKSNSAEKCVKCMGLDTPDRLDTVQLQKLF